MFLKGLVGVITASLVGDMLKMLENGQGILELDKNKFLNFLKKEFGNASTVNLTLIPAKILKHVIGWYLERGVVYITFSRIGHPKLPYSFIFDRFTEVLTKHLTVSWFFVVFFFCVWKKIDDDGKMIVQLD